MTTRVSFYPTISLNLAVLRDQPARNELQSENLQPSYFR
jgi:hypothetical protein